MSPATSPPPAAGADDRYVAGLEGPVEFDYAHLFRGVDLLDGTPVLDIKPFEPHLDVPGYQPGHNWLDHVRGGWYQRNNAAANPLIHPGQPGLQAAGWEPSPPADPSTDNQETA